MRKIRAAISLLALSTSLGVSLPRAGAQEISLEAIRQAWARREESVRSIRVKYSEKQLFAKGTTENSPKSDTTSDSSYQVLIKGSMMRFESKRPVWYDRYSYSRPGGGVSVFDGKKIVSLSIAGGVNPFPTASVGKSTRPNITTVLTHWPIFATFRPFDPHLGVLSDQKWELDKTRAMINDSECLVLKYTPSYQKIYWVDANTFKVVRTALENEGLLAYQIDLFYKKDNRIGEVLAGWRLVVLYPDQTTDFTSDVVVSELTLDGPDEPDDFRLEIPAGTRVSDDTLKHDYILRKDRTKRFILPEEDIKATYEELATSEMGDLLLQRPGRRPWLVPVVIGTLAVASFAFYFWRRLK